MSRTVMWGETKVSREVALGLAQSELIIDMVRIWQTKVGAYKRTPCPESCRDYREERVVKAHSAATAREVRARVGVNTARDATFSDDALRQFCYTVGEVISPEAVHVKGAQR